MQARPERRQTPPGRLLGPARGRRRTRALQPPAGRKSGHHGSGADCPRPGSAGPGNPGGRGSRPGGIARLRRPAPTAPRRRCHPAAAGAEVWRHPVPTQSPARDRQLLFQAPRMNLPARRNEPGAGCSRRSCRAAAFWGPGRRAYGMGPRRDRPRPLPPFDRIFRRAGILRSGLERGVAGRSLPGHLLAGVRVTPADKTDIYRRGGVAPDKMHLGSRPRMPQRPAAVPGEAAA